MLLNIVKAKAQSGEDIPFEVEFNLNDDIILFKGYKFLSPAIVKGNMNYQNSKLLVTADVKFKIMARCDSCGEEFQKDIQFNLEEYFVESFASHNEEDYIILNQTSVEIDKPITDNLLLNIPSRMLCKQNCKGLCSICGKNKNYYSCNCKSLEEELDKLDNPFNQLKK